MQPWRAAESWSNRSGHQGSTSTSAWDQSSVWQITELMRREPCSSGTCWSVPHSWALLCTHSPRKARGQRSNLSRGTDWQPESPVWERSRSTSIRTKAASEKQSHPKHPLLWDWKDWSKSSGKTRWVYDPHLAGASSASAPGSCHGGDDDVRWGGDCGGKAFWISGLHGWRTWVGQWVVVVSWGLLTSWRRWLVHLDEAWWVG